MTMQSIVLVPYRDACTPIYHHDSYGNVQITPASHIAAAYSTVQTYSTVALPYSRTAAAASQG